MDFFVIPQPKEFHCDAGPMVFRLTRLLNLHSDNASEPAKAALLRFLARSFEIEPLTSGWEHIHLQTKADPAAPEGYRLTVCENKVTIVGSDPAGTFYGVQTLAQLLLQNDGELPELSITDAPRLPYRGLMLDCASCFLPKADILRYLDAMALHKLNRLHWHLTDDGGWRLELYQNLLFAQIGGTGRTARRFGLQTQFYTKADVAEILAYAAERFITVVPEIDAPGHVTAALAAYPDLGCIETQRLPKVQKSISSNVLCLGKETTFTRMQSVFDEVCRDFPSLPIHIGGNDVPFDRWRACPQCQARLRSLGATDGAALYADYIDRTARLLKAKDRTVLRWKDDADRLVTEQTLLQLRTDADVDPARAVVSFEDAFRFSRSTRKLPLRTVYDRLPLVGGRTAFGAEGCLWTAGCKSDAETYGLVFPHLAAFCETAWSDPAVKDFPRFLRGLPAYRKALLTVGIDCDVRRFVRKG
ncbi:MAG: beta-N-acetylhexosaminidase [Clostridia bacterium]|nr:beta-N-acetylhexosaminidase [Clostridia bacterium]